VTARKFFYVAAAMLMLALSYHLGASGAAAQAGGRLVGAFVMQGCSPWLAVAADDGGRVYMRSQSGGWTVAAQLPGTPTAVTPAVNRAFGEWGYVSMADGTIYGIFSSDCVSVTLSPVLGSPLGAPTPTLHESWGSLKARYAPQSAPVLQAPTNK